MNRVVSKWNDSRRSTASRQNDGFRSTAIETLRWFCAETDASEIGGALGRLFASSPRCELLNCRVRIDDSASKSTRSSEEQSPDETQQINPPSELRDDETIAQFVLNGESHDHKSWEASVSLAVRSGGAEVWQTVLEDIGSEGCGSCNDSSDDADSITNRLITESEFAALGFPSDRGTELDFEDLCHHAVHEIRNPLGAIITASSLVKGCAGEPLSTDDLDLLGIIERESQRIDATLGLYMKYVCKPKLDCTNQSILDLIENSILSCNSTAELRAVGSKESFIAYADSGLLGEAFEYFIARVPKDDPDLNVASITCSSNAESIVIEFKYDGERIRPDLLRKVVLPFDTAKDGGSGLESAPAYSILKAHGGRLSIGSSGESTTFTILLPKRRDFEND